MYNSIVVWHALGSWLLCLNPQNLSVFVILYSLLKNKIVNSQKQLVTKLIVKTLITLLTFLFQREGVWLDKTVYYITVSQHSMLGVATFLQEACWAGIQTICQFVLSFMDGEGIFLCDLLKKTCVLFVTCPFYVDSAQNVYPYLPLSDCLLYSYV